MVKVKICGITNLEDALSAINAGCQALGFVFYRKSPRYIDPGKAKDIIRRLPRGIVKVGVFVNAQPKTIRRIARLCGLDMVQLHGEESPEFCRKLKGLKIVKAFRIKDRIALQNILQYKSKMYLFDTFINSRFGGTGKNFNWNLLKQAQRLRRPIFLSGGLNEENVRKAIRIVRPDWVDVSSSVEIRPGKKDYRKIKRFITAVSGRETKA